MFHFTFFILITFQLQSNVSSCMILVWALCQLASITMGAPRPEHATTLHAHSLLGL